MNRIQLAANFILALACVFLVVSNYTRVKQNKALIERLDAVISAHSQLDLIVDDGDAMGGTIADDVLTEIADTIQTEHAAFCSCGSFSAQSNSAAAVANSIREHTDAVRNEPGHTVYEFHRDERGSDRHYDSIADDVVEPSLKKYR